MESHAEFLRLVTMDEGLAEAVKRDWRAAPLSGRERAMLAYVEKLTLAPSKVGRDDVDALRGMGLDDRGVLQLNLICSWFNYINRVAEGLGVGRM
ncbi:carboxymuconolactone decarboxylase family protein [Geodermatophilus marinus]|uniref:carboxymuconolactone decarboxylase family protein n=1 Tax=Geodermatophilus sp. LHW52908 TaxID=2303986 RepID=UPI0011C1A0B2|nr:peroxidase [Geodermatophilus sp. LHW52908]